MVTAPVKSWLRAGLVRASSEESVLKLRHRLGRINKNDYYDKLTELAMRRVIVRGSVCVDVGCADGMLLDWMLSCNPSRALAFEPIPEQFAHLESRFGGDSRVRLHQCALSDEPGPTTFQWVQGGGYSGLRRLHEYPGNPTIVEIQVERRTFDSIAREQGLTRLDFVKIDVEGAESLVLKGARETLARFRPVVVFEYGWWGTRSYGCEPEDMFAILQGCNLSVSTLPRFLARERGFTLQEFARVFETGEFYWVAHP